jgi:hypothetical protein
VQYEQKDMEGAAFQKDKTEDWHADWSGKAMVDGTMYWLNISGICISYSYPRKGR